MIKKAVKFTFMFLTGKSEISLLHYSGLNERKREKNLLLIKMLQHT